VRPVLGKGASSVVQEVVDKLFDKLKRRWIGTPASYGKQIVLDAKPSFSLKGLYDYTGIQNGVIPSEVGFQSIQKIAESYLDAYKATASAKIIQAINSVLHEASMNGKEVDFEKVLQTQIYDIMGKTTEGITKIINTESNGTKNYSTLEAITKINADVEISDPTIGWRCVHDDRLCRSCARLHLLEDGVTPRLWRLSDCISGYVADKRTTLYPSLFSLHPNERCILFTVLPGWGFNREGKLTYVAPGHDAIKGQPE
jgi:hypothetical protein